MDDFQKATSRTQTGESVMWYPVALTSMPSAGPDTVFSMAGSAQLNL